MQRDVPEIDGYDGRSFHHRIIDALPEAIVKTDIKGTITYASPRAAELNGIASASELLGRDCLQLIAPDERARAVAGMQETLDKGRLRFAQYRFQRLDGSYFDGELSAAVTTDGAGNPVGFVAIVRDVSARVAAPEARGEAGESDALDNKHPSVRTRPAEPTGALIGDDRKLQRLRDLIHTVAPTSATVLIQGETGTGKDLVARAIHAASTRSDGPLVKIDCGALADPLLESELFGHEEGAFTGATSRRKGRFEHAHGGTVFLDEIQNTSPSLQVKLLRVVEEGRFERVGGAETVAADVRIIAASNQMLESCVASGSFRNDLYYRLNIVPVHVPALRERPGDIVPLAEHFLDVFSARHGLRRPALSPEAAESLRAETWPGNVRQLENVIEQAVVLCNTTELTPDHFNVPDTSSPQTLPVGTFADALRHAARSAIVNALKLADGNRTRAAEILGISRSALYARMRDYGLREPAV